jgi:hypothetical protein
MLPHLVSGSSFDNSMKVLLDLKQNAGWNTSLHCWGDNTEQMRITCPLSYVDRAFTSNVLQGSPRAQANQFQDNL